MFKNYNIRSSFLRIIAALSCVFISSRVFAKNDKEKKINQDNRKGVKDKAEEKNISPLINNYAHKKLVYNIPLTFGKEKESEQNSFFSCTCRMRNVMRWTLLRNIEREDIEQHSCEVARIAHALAVIKNKKYGGDVNIEKVLLYSLYHDIQEVSTSDFPNPVKYFDSHLTNSLKQMEKIVSENFLTLIDDKEIREEYRDAFIAKKSDKEVWRLVKIADILSSMIKCLREKDLGNNDFRKAFDDIYKKVMTLEEPEAKYFIKVFMPSFNMPIPKDYYYPTFLEKKK